MSKRMKIGLVLAALGLLGGLGTYSFFDSHERQDVEIEQPPEPEARVNPHLGLEHFLEAMDIDVEPRPDPADPDRVKEADVFVFSADLAVYEDWWQSAVDDWLRYGGHLIVVDTDEHSEGPTAALNEALRLESIAPGAPDVPEDSIAEYDYDLSGLSQFAFGDLGDELADEIDEIDEDLQLEDDSKEESVMAARGADFVALATEGEDVLATSASRNQGRLTVIPEGQILTNQGLEGGEVGRLVADVLAIDGKWPEDAVFFVRSGQRSWLMEVWQRGWPVFAGLLILLGLGLSRARRFGPSIPEAGRRRRRRSDHIRATGHFLWKQGGSDVLVESTRRALIDELNRRRPSLGTMDQQRRLEVMADELQMSVGQLKRLLDAPVPKRAADVQSLIVELERIRRKL